MGASLTAGAFCGAGEVGLVFLSFGLLGGDAENSFQMAVIAFPVALICWTIGLILVGAPGWILLHALGLRSRLAAGAYGAVAAFAGGFGAQAWILPHARHWSDYLAAAGVVALMGAPVGWVVAATAYRPERTAR
jgi:hypothetical protein